MSQRLNYRTPDGIIHLWTQEEIDQHIQAMNTPIIDMVPKARDVALHVEQMGRATPSFFEDDAVSMQEEAILTVKMLYDLLYRRSVPACPLGHEQVQDLLSRIDVMGEPLKAMVRALEVKR